MPRSAGVQLDTIPVDYVAEVIVRSSNRSDWAGMILHLCSGPEHAMQISFLQKSVSEIYKKYGKKVPRPLIIPLPLFKAIIQSGKACRIAENSTGPEHPALFL